MPGKCEWRRGRIGAAQTIARDDFDQKLWLLHGFWAAEPAVPTKQILITGRSDASSQIMSMIDHRTGVEKRAREDTTDGDCIRM